MTTSVVGLKKNKQPKTVTYAKISPKMVNPRDRAGNAEEEEGSVPWSVIALSVDSVYRCQVFIASMEEVVS